MENKKPIIIAGICLGVLGVLSLPLLKSAYDKIYTNGERIAVLESQRRGDVELVRSIDKKLDKLADLIPDVAAIKAKVENLERGQ